MGSSSSRRLRGRRVDNSPHGREFQKIALARAKWRLRFYCWGCCVVLVPATAQAVEAVVALIEGRQPHFFVEIK